MTSSDFLAILPLIVLVGWALLVLLVDLWLPVERKWVTPLLAVICLHERIDLLHAFWIVLALASVFILSR